MLKLLARGIAGLGQTSGSRGRKERSTGARQGCFLGGPDEAKDIRDEEKLMRLVTDYLYRVRERVYTRRKKYLYVQMDGMTDGGSGAIGSAFRK